VHDGLAKAGEGNRLDRQAGLLAHLAHDGLREGLADFDHSARQGEEAMGRRARARTTRILPSRTIAALAAR
jgi:hypothetical protein